MAKREHSQILIESNNKSDICEWRNAHPGERFDCTGLVVDGRDFTGWDLDGVDFTGASLAGATFATAMCNGAIFKSANLSGANFNYCKLQRADLSTSKLTSATFVDAELQEALLTDADARQANFRGANLTGASLSGARLEDAKCTSIIVPDVSFDGVTLSATIFDKAEMQGCDFRKTHFRGPSSFNGTELQNAKFDGVSVFGSNFSDAILVRASFVEANLAAAVFARATCTRANFSGTKAVRANFQEADLQHADLQHADMYESNISAANFENARGLFDTKGLETVRSGHDETREQYFDQVEIPWLERHLSWERIRWLGRLPLFAASYAALIAIPFLFYFLDFYNRQVTAARDWAAVASKNDAPPPAAKYLLEHLRLEGIPDQSVAILAAAVCLAIGSSIFVLLCPSRIREFSRDQWTDEFRRSLVHYWALSWKNRTARVLCVIFYAVGASLALYVLVTKIVRVAIFIWQNWNVGQ